MKRALVTGGSGAIGSAICRRLASCGHHVIIHAHRHPERASALADDIRTAGGSAETLCFDVRDADHCRSVLEQNLTLGPVQILVNNAGCHDDAPLAGMRAEQWHDVIDTSLHGFFNVSQPLLLPMMATRWGRIINLSSVAAQLGNRGQANYAAAKAGLHGASKSLALELATRGITVNVVAPGIIGSGMTDGVFDPDTIKRLVPMKRAGTPDEVAALVAFLASDEAAYLTGQIIGLNGGMA
ncbi:MAG: 3-oxoacyl-ACP reductase FabG [Gammaproteobacteria bacterium]|jgi:3-oxoacyl-[acyl-carrier protein] reductase|nr:3-oxoacyl-ACP reductase FabG [Gammaproteobacteria bacterium]MBU1408441.1 3-oxoacyl-ACP reductase FabG [Gammaproteobacteria bacterium]MBU1532253.1 3-oxoacyl-ACP reductase FabG [Gammaproteobacteria bacterium]